MRTTAGLRRLGITVGVVLLLGTVGCGSDGGGSPSGGTDPPADDPATDKLAQVQARGTLILFTDPEYPPQSFRVKGAKRPTSTKCAPNALTAGEIAGYDTDTGELVAEALGVEPCFVTPSWTEVTAGNWGDHWDLAYGSGAVDYDRMEVLYMTQPYYSTPTNFFVPASSKARQPADLSGTRVGACAGCTMEKYLRGTLQLPGPRVEQLVTDPQVVTFDTEVPGLEATAKRKIAGFLCSEPVGAEAIAEGSRLRMLPQPAYHSHKTGYVDKKSGLRVRRFVEAVNEVIAARHADGTLGRLSKKYFGRDYAAKAAEFDLATIEQTVQ